MKKSVFYQNWASEFKNSRNMGAGGLNAKKPKDFLSDFEYLRFGIYRGDNQEMSKLAQLKLLNLHVNSCKVPFKFLKLSDLNETILHQFFEEFGLEFEIDGLIIDINQSELRLDLGREKNGNPVYARAWKGYTAKTQATIIRDISWQVSKFGLLKPVAHLVPVELDGVTVSNVTLVHAKNVMDEKLGIGANVTLIRSGQVIPKIVSVNESKEPVLPNLCPSCDTPVSWNENKIELVCENKISCPEQQIQKMIAFFQILGVENMAVGIIRQFYNHGYDTVQKILKLTPGEMESLEGYQVKRANLIYQSIHEKMKDVPLEIIRHASSIFEGLGSKKLALLNSFNSIDQIPKIEDLVKIEGFSEISAKIFIQGYAKFWEFAATLPTNIKFSSELVPTGNKLADFQVCFSGIRSKNLEQIITENGGKVVGSVSKKTSYLVMKDVGSNSSKEKKALSIGVLVMTLKEFELKLKEKMGDPIPKDLCATTLL